MVNATALPRPYVHAARIVEFCDSVGSGDARITSTSEFSFTLVSTKPLIGGNVSSEPLHDFMLRRDLRADRRLRLVHQRPGDPPGLALKNLRQRVGVVHHVILAAGCVAMFCSVVLPAGPCEPTATVVTVTPPSFSAVDRACAGRRRVAVADDDHVLDRPRRCSRPSPPPPSSCSGRSRACRRSSSGRSATASSADSARRAPCRPATGPTAIDRYRPK